MLEGYIEPRSPVSCVLGPNAGIHARVQRTRILDSSLPASSNHHSVNVTPLVNLMVNTTTVGGQCRENVVWPSFDELNLTPSSTYKCPACDMTFHDKSKFRQHYMIHSGEKPYGCLLCPYRTRHRHVLKSHMHSKHS